MLSVLRYLCDSDEVRKMLKLSCDFLEKVVLAFSTYLSAKDGHLDLNGSATVARQCSTVLPFAGQVMCEMRKHI